MNGQGGPESPKRTHVTKRCMPPSLPHVPATQLLHLTRSSCTVPASLFTLQVCSVQQGGCFAEEVVAPAVATWHLPGGTACGAQLCQVHWSSEVPAGTAGM
jgi:hypothetical protein